MEYWIISGTREFNDRKFIYEQCHKILSKRFKPITIIAGGARGVDKIAIDFAKAYGIPWIEIPANWTLYGKQRAGAIRNQKMATMAKQKGDAYLIAFWDGKSSGTDNMIKIAKREHIETITIRFDQKENKVTKSASMLFKNKDGK